MKQDIKLFQPVVPDFSVPGGLAGTVPIALHTEGLWGLSPLPCACRACRVQTVTSPVDHVREGPYPERFCATYRNRAVFKSALLWD